MEKMKELWNRKGVKNIVFLAFLCVAYFTDFPLWVSVQYNTLMLSSPEIEKEATEAPPNLYTSDALLISQAGDSLTLGQLKGRPVFINFWATWCVPCIAEFPSLMNLRDELKGEVDFLFVSREKGNSVADFLKKRGLSEDFYRQITKVPVAIQSKSIPASFIINGKGEVVFKEIGAVDWDAAGTADKVRTLVR